MADGCCRAPWLGIALLAAFGGGAAAEPAAERQQDLLHLLRHDCGSCHGMRLTGGLGPPLTPQALAGKPATALTAVVLQGRPGTPMPPWGTELSADEAQWLVERLIQGLDP